MGRSDTKEQIPIDKIADVLRNPGHYSELYPETLPLTRRLYQQLGTQEPTKPAPAIVPYEPVQAIEQAMGQPKERLYFQHPAMNDVDTVRPGRNAIHRDTRGYQGQQQTRSPIEQDATPTRTYSDATLSVVETDMVCDVEVVPRTQDRRQQEIGVRALTWMDILERGEWPLPCGVEMGDLFVVLCKETV